MATIVDVARLAQVSVSTVSHVLNATRRVNPDTRQRVLDVISATGYVRHASARALRRAQSDSIGLVVSDTAQPVFAEMIRGVEAEATAHGFTLLLANSAEDADRENRAIDVLHERRVDGLIVAQAAGAGSGHLDTARGNGIPVVLLDRVGLAGFDQVGVENEQAMRALVRHLVRLGHRHILAVAGDLRVSTMAERHQGYRDALAEAGLPYLSDDVVEGSGLEGETEAALVDVLNRRDRPTAVVTSSTPMAVGALRAARRQGLEIPTDLAFATFDSPRYPDLLTPPLTTVEQPAFEVGRDAMRLLVTRLNHPECPPTAERLPPTIVHRDSCCPPLPGGKEQL